MQCGIWMVYMNYAFNMEPQFFHITSVGPQLMACAGAILTGLLLNGLRMWRGRIVNIHFLLILIGSALFVVVGVLSVMDTGKERLL